MAKKQYTRDERIDYYIDLIEEQEAKLTLLKIKIKGYKKRLEYLQSDEYQDWSSDLEKDLENKNPR
jgi:hypothetical protein